MQTSMNWVFTWARTDQIQRKGLVHTKPWWVNLFLSLRSQLFYYSTGMSTGLIASLLILIFILGKFLPKVRFNTSSLTVSFTVFNVNFETVYYLAVYTVKISIKIQVHVNILLVLSWKWMSVLTFLLVVPYRKTLSMCWSLEAGPSLCT